MPIRVRLICRPESPQKWHLIHYLKLKDKLHQKEPHPISYFADKESKFEVEAQNSNCATLPQTAECIGQKL
jgi:hypothetical protein